MMTNVFLFISLISSVDKTGMTIDEYKMNKGPGKMNKGPGKPVK